MDVSLLIRLIDQVTGPAKQVRQSLGAIGTGAKEFAGGLGDAFKEGFSVENVELATRNAEAALGRARGRLMGAVGMAASLFAPLKIGGDFEQAMNNVSALSNATAEEFAALKQQARDLGRVTQFSASQAADAMGFLAMAGFKSNDILGAMPGTLQLAAAAQMDLGRAADIVSNILTGYGMQVDDLGHVNDVLVKSFTSANTDLSQLGEAFKYGGGVAAGAGLQFEEAAAALALMGNAGLQGSMAGTGLRGAISRMLNPTKQMRNAMKEAGLTFTDANGRLLPFLEIVQQLEEHVEDAGLFMALYGDRAGNAMLQLAMQGSDALRELTAELEASGGTAERVAGVQMEGFNGSLRGFRSAMEGVMLTLADGLLPAVTDLVHAVTPLVNAFTDFAQANPELVKWGTLLVATLMGMSIASRLFAFALAGLRLPLIGLFRAFLLFRDGRNIATGWRLLSGATRALGGAATFAGRSIAGLTRHFGGLRNTLRRGITAGWAIPLAFEFLDDMGRTPEERLEHIRRNQEAYQQFSKRVDESGFGRWWQSIKDGANNLLGLDQGEVPAEALARWLGEGWASFDQAWTERTTQIRASAAELGSQLLAGLQSRWSEVEGWVDRQIAWLASAWSEADLAGPLSASISGMVDGLDAAWASVEAWINGKVEWLRSAFSFDISLPSWLGGGGGADDQAVRRSEAITGYAAGSAPGAARDGLANGAASELARGGDEGGRALAKGGSDAGNALQQGAAALREAAGTLRAAVAAASRSAATGGGLHSALATSRTSALHGGTE